MKQKKQACSYLQLHPCSAAQGRRKKGGGGLVGPGGVGEDHPPDFDRSVNLSGETSCPYGGEK